jgi:glyoxylase I family protein
MRMDHVAIACQDVERMRAWYERVLGFGIVARRAPSPPDATGTPCAPAPQPTYLVGPPDGGATIELMPDDRGATAPRKPLTRGISHIAIRVPDIGEWEVRLTEFGVRWLGERAEATGGGMVRSFLDPEDNMLQIVQR